MPIINIYDFDQTLTQDHTFEKNALEQKPGENYHEQWYLKGKLDAKTNTKRGIENIFKHNSETISAIATYHNNPSYVAGYVAYILQKELIIDPNCSPQKPLLSKDNYQTAIARYLIKGETVPLLISYIADDVNYNQKVYRLMKQGKNNQIKSLIDRLISDEKQTINNNTIVNFYDDSEPNFIKAQNNIDETRVPINCYYIARNNPTFTILKTNISIYPSPIVVEQDILPIPNTNGLTSQIVSKISQIDTANSNQSRPKGKRAFSETSLTLLNSRNCSFFEHHKKKLAVSSDANPTFSSNNSILTAG